MDVQDVLDNVNFTLHKTLHPTINALASINSYLSYKLLWIRNLWKFP